MLEWMLYVSVVSALLAAGAVAGERSASLWGIPRRWIWCGALATSIGIALFAWLVPAGPDLADPGPRVEVHGTAAGESGTGPSSSATPGLRLRLPELDGYLRMGWLALSVATLAALAASARGLGRQVRKCVPGKVNGRRVLLSDRLGPAVVGFRHPTIVLPKWVVELERGERDLILAHEEEHVFAGDQRLVALWLLALVVAPWNLALWWKLPRLRQAIELDCDQRVLRRGCNVSAYGSLILRASRRPSVGSGFGSPFGEPAVSLERRISAMVATVPRFRLLHGAIAGSLSALLVLAACSLDRPAGVTATANAAAQAVDGALPVAAQQDGRVRVNQLSSVLDFDANRDQIVLEVKAGPSYFINRQPVPVPELRSFIGLLYPPRPRKVLFVTADAGLPVGDLEAAVEAARAGMGDALDEAKLHGARDESATINVVTPPGR